MGTVPAVGEDTGRGSHIDRTDDLGLGTGGSWWCNEEGRGILISWPRKRSFISCVRGRNLARMIYSHDRAVLR